MRRWTLVALGLAVAAGCTPGSPTAGDLPPGANARVTKVVDGDTIDVEVG